MLFNAIFPNTYTYIYYIWFWLFRFYGQSIILGYSMGNLYIFDIYDLVCLGLMANPRFLFISCQILCIYIYWAYWIWFRWVLLHKNISGYFMPNSLYSYILIILFYFFLGFRHINHFRSFKAIFSLYKHIRYIYMILFSWVLKHINHCCFFLLCQTIFYTDILDIYDFVWLDSMANQSS